MINFIRKIRQKFLTKNKFSKYLLYAIGEILNSAVPKYYEALKEDDDFKVLVQQNTHIIYKT